MNFIKFIALVWLCLSAVIPTHAQSIVTSPTESSAQIAVDLSSQTLTVFKLGSPIFTTGISSGKPGFETPEGTAKVIGKEVKGYSRTYKCETPYMLELDFKDQRGNLRGIRIHEGIVYPNRYPLSHACIRVPKGAAQKVFSLCPIGTSVEVRGSIFDYLDQHFEGFHLLHQVKANGGVELQFRLNPDGSLTEEFIAAFHKGILQLCQVDPKTGKYTPDRSKWLIGWQFLKIHNCIPVPKYERQTREVVRLRRPGE